MGNCFINIIQALFFPFSSLLFFFSSDTLKIQNYFHIYRERNRKKGSDEIFYLCIFFSRKSLKKNRTNMTAGPKNESDKKFCLTKRKWEDKKIILGYRGISLRRTSSLRFLLNLNNETITKFKGIFFCSFLVKKFEFF